MKIRVVMIQGKVLRKGVFDQHVEVAIPGPGNYIAKVENVVRNVRVQ